MILINGMSIFYHSVYFKGGKMKVIINADDLGYTIGNTDGIIEGYHKGIIRSTTAMCNMPYLEYAQHMVKNCPDLGIGVHLTLTIGYSLTKNKTLTDEKGKFLNRNSIYQKELDTQELYNEWKAQIERFIRVFNRFPTHLDSHHSVHDFNQKQLSVSSYLAKEYGIPMRRHSCFTYVGEFRKDAITPDGLINILNKYHNNNIEIMTHPGFCDLELYEQSSYNWQRVQELSVLCNKEVKKFIIDNQIEITHY